MAKKPKNITLHPDIIIKGMKLCNKKGRNFSELVEDLINAEYMSSIKKRSVSLS